MFDAPRFDDTVSDVFVVGNNEEVKQEFLNSVPNYKFRLLDACRLANALTVGRMTLLS